VVPLEVPEFDRWRAAAERAAGAATLQGSAGFTFEDLGGGRTRLTSTSLVGSFEDRAAFVASGMEDGVREGYERLDELLAG
jgi:uncharacterized protein YndB with AHSA1/START domain